MARIFHKLLGFDKEFGATLPEQKLVFNGTFSLSYLYWMMREWLIENDWVSRDDAAFGETYYEQRETANGDEIRFRWSHAKESKTLKPGDINFGYELDIRVQVLFFKEAEIVVDGKKVKVNSGEIIIETFPRYKLLTKWEGSMKKLAPWVFKRLNFAKWDAAKIAGIIEADQFQNVLKTYFQLTPGAAPEHEAMYLTREQGK